MGADNPTKALIAGLVGLSIGGFAYCTKIDDVPVGEPMLTKPVTAVVEPLEELANKTEITTAPAVIPSEHTTAPSEYAAAETEYRTELTTDELRALSNEAKWSGHITDKYGSEAAERAFRIGRAELRLNRKFLEILRLWDPQIQEHEHEGSMGFGGIVGEDGEDNLDSINITTNDMVYPIRKFLIEMYLSREYGYDKNLETQERNTEAMQAILEGLNIEIVKQRAQEIAMEKTLWEETGLEPTKVDHILWETYKLTKLFDPNVTQAQVRKTELFEYEDLGFTRILRPFDPNDLYNDSTLLPISRQIVELKYGEGFELQVPKSYIKAKMAEQSADNLNMLIENRRYGWTSPTGLLNDSSPQEYFTRLLPDFNGKSFNISIMGTYADGNDLMGSVKYTNTQGEEVEKQVKLGPIDSLVRKH